jgi:predicted transposase YbfD/YdcC
LRSWAQAALQGNNGDVIAIDGKALRRSHDQYWGQDAILVVNAWATQAGVTLGQLRTSAESNEVPTLTQLLKQLRLKDCIVTADAMHCQTENALEVVEQGGDYVFAAKGNQGLLQQHIIEIFDNPMDGVKFDTARTLEKQHGRIEERVCTVLTHSGLLEYADPHERWFGLKSIIRMERKQTRVLDGEIKQNTSYYISSLDVSANRLMSIIRSHWLIENALHWVLDVEFNEDRARSRKGHAADNFAVLRRLALNLLKLTPIPMRTRQPSIKIRRKRALWDKPYLLRVLGALT